jgi:hypothetical protein
MGLAKFKRPVLLPKGLQAGVGGSTFTGKVVLSGSSARLVVSNTTQAVAAADATLSGHTAQFITVGTSGSGRELIIPAPSAKGEVKYLFFDNQTTSVDTRIHTNATANTFWGTTYNTASMAAASTGSPGGTPGGTMSLTLVAASTTQWALITGTTFNWDLSASTGSTGIA